MLRLVTLLFVFFLSLSACAQPRIKLVYSDLTFSLPGSISAMGDAGGGQNILIVRYGDVKGQNFIAFSDMTNDSSLDYGCPAAVFFRGVFSDSVDKACNKESLDIMRQVFVEGKDVASWSTKDYEIKYSKDHNKIFAFIIGGNGKLVKIDSDFISKDSLKRILGNM